MPVSVFRRVSIVLLAFAAISLAACSGEESQRKAFIEYLQTKVIDAKRLTVPRPKPEEAKAIGEYAGHLKVLSDFHDGMEQNVNQSFKDVMKKGGVRSIGDAIERVDDIRTAKDALSGLKEMMAGELKKASEAKAALKMPDDLKPIYDKAFERNVEMPATAFANALPAMDSALGVTLELVEFLKSNEDKIKINGLMIESEDPALVDRINGYVNSMNEQQRALQNALSEMNSNFSGR